MTSETAEQFLERMRNDLDWDMPEDELDRLFALARRGAAIENHGQDAKPSKVSSQWRPITEEDREWIDARAYDLYKGWQRNMGAVRTNAMRSEDNICHWIMDATLERMRLFPTPPPAGEPRDE